MSPPAVALGASSVSSACGAWGVAGERNCQIARKPATNNTYTSARLPIRPAEPFSRTLACATSPILRSTDSACGAGRVAARPAVARVDRAKGAAAGATAAIQSVTVGSLACGRFRHVWRALAVDARRPRLQHALIGPHDGAFARHREPDQQCSLAGKVRAQRLPIAGSLEDNRLGELGAGERVRDASGSPAPPRRPGAPAASPVNARISARIAYAPVRFTRSWPRTSTLRGRGDGRGGVLERGREGAAAEGDGRAVQVGDAPHVAPSDRRLHVVEGAPRPLRAGRG